MGPDGVCSQVLREMADVTARPLSITFERSERTGEVPKDWKPMLLPSSERVRTG